MPRYTYIAFVLLAEVVVSPPFVYLSLVRSLLRSDFAVAAQNMWARKGGAYTGEIRFWNKSLTRMFINFQIEELHFYAFVEPMKGGYRMSVLQC